MRAITVTDNVEGPDALRLADVPDPHPKPGHALVRVSHSGVNFIDIYMRRERATPILGMEASGAVLELGADTVAPEGIAPGARVGWLMHPGTYAQLASVPVDRLVPLPADVDNQSAAAILLQGITAQYLVSDSHAVEARQDILVHAAGGGVGTLLCQLARARGARVIGVTSSDEKEGIARQAGADDIVRSDRQDIVTATRELTAGHGAHAVYDGINRATFDASLDATRRHGTVVLYGEASGEVDPVVIRRLQSHGSLHLTYPNIEHFIESREQLLHRANEIFEARRTGVLRQYHTTLPLKSAAHAHQTLEDRSNVGKITLAIDDARSAPLAGRHRDS